MTRRWERSPTPTSSSTGRAASHWRLTTVQSCATLRRSQPGWSFQAQCRSTSPAKCSQNASLPSGAEHPVAAVIVAAAEVVRHRPVPPTFGITRRHTARSSTSVKRFSAFRDLLRSHLCSNLIPTC
jgi:hypothetical protein